MSPKERVLPSSTHEGEVRCSHCGELIVVAPGAWPYRYTQVLTHLMLCARGVSDEYRKDAARAMTKAD
jgi:hypothetical protein